MDMALGVQGTCYNRGRERESEHLCIGMGPVYDTELCATRFYNWLGITASDCILDGVGMFMAGEFREFREFMETSIRRVQKVGPERASCACYLCAAHAGAIGRMGRGAPVRACQCLGPISPSSGLTVTAPGSRVAQTRPPPLWTGLPAPPFGILSPMVTLRPPILPRPPQRSPTPMGLSAQVT